MLKTFCDKCGNQFTSYLFQQVKFPVIIMTRMDSPDDKARPIDLCPKCMYEFKKWLETPKISEKEET